MAKWLQGCEICNAGLCAEMDRLIEVGFSERKAAQQLVKQQEMSLHTELYSVASILNRYRYYKGLKKVNQNDSPQKGDSPSLQPEEPLPDFPTVDDAELPQADDEEKTPELKHTETYEVTHAMEFATIAISQLERIRDDDPQRSNALQRVVDWITKNQ
jgi:hypothetical protein